MNSLSSHSLRSVLGAILLLAGLSASAASIVGFSSKCFSTVESNRVAVVTVDRKSGDAGPAIVDIEAYPMAVADPKLGCVSQATPAVAGRDFTAGRTRVTWNAGESGLREVQIPVSWSTDPNESDGLLQYPDSVIYPGYFGVRLVPVDVGDAAFGLTNAVVVIQKSPAPNGLLRTSAPYVIIPFQGPVAPFVSLPYPTGQFAVGFEREGSLAGAVSAKYQVKPAPPADGVTPGKPGIDFALLEGWISWNDGEAGVKTVTLPLPAYPQPPEFGGKSFVVQLTATTGGALVQTGIDRAGSVVPFDHYDCVRWGPERKQFILYPTGQRAGFATPLEYDCTRWDLEAVEVASDLGQWSAISWSDLLLGLPVSPNATDPTNVTWSPYYPTPCHFGIPQPGALTQYYLRETSATVPGTRYYRLRLTPVLPTIP